METVSINSVELENAVAYFKKSQEKISFELTASEATDIRIALNLQILHIWEMENVDYEVKKANVDYFENLYNKFGTE